MKLDLFNNFIDAVRENDFVQNFMKEVKEYMEKSRNETNDVPILEQIRSERNMSTVSENKIRNCIDEILINYANETLEQGTMYFVVSKSKYRENAYNVCEVIEGKVKTIPIEKNELPENIGVNSVCREEAGQLVLDNVATECIEKEIKEKAQQILIEQDIKLSEYRKQGHLYVVTEEINDKRFLWDLTDRPKNEIEEVDFPKDLLDQAIAGTVLVYENGHYKYYSNDGFERMEEN